MTTRQIVVSIAVLLFTAAPGRLSAQNLEVRLSDDGALTLRAANVRLSEVLAALKKQYGLTVTVPDFRDTTITAAFENVPLAQGLASLVPADSRPSFTFGEREVSVPGSTGDKPGRLRERDARLPTKADGAVIPLNPDLPQKPAATSTRRPREGGSLKPAPGTVVVKYGKGPKVPRQARPDTTRHIWFALAVDSAGRITVEGTRVMSGRRVVSEHDDAQFFYTIDVGSQTVAAEGLYDPFEAHAYGPRPTDPHRSFKGRSGHFTATMPYDGANRLLNEPITIRLHRLGNSASGKSFNLNELRDVTRNSTIVATSNAASIRGALRRALQLPPQR